MKKRDIEKYIKENYPDLFVARVRDYAKINKIKDFLEFTKKEQKSEEEIEKRYASLEKMIKSTGFSYFEDWLDQQMYSCISQIMDIQNYEVDKVKFIQLQSRYEAYQDIKRYLLITMRKLDEIRKKKRNED